MASWLGRNDWESVLGRWAKAGLLGDETTEAIRAWEAEQAARSSASRLVDALSYLGVSIVLVGALLGVGLMDSSDDGTIYLPLAMGLAAGLLARRAWRFELRAVSDGFAASTVILLSLALGIGLERVGDGDQYAVGFFLICLCSLLVGGLMVRLVSSRLATLLAAVALGLMPFSIVVEDDALNVILDGGTAWLSGWELWGAFAAVIAVGIVAQIVMLRPSRLIDADAAPWARLGASLATGVAMLWLASSSPVEAFDWMPLLAGWLVTALAFRQNRFELLPASALLLLGALAGGLSSLDSDLRFALTIVVLFSALQVTVIGMAGPRLLGPLAEHWLMPFWQAALLAGGVVAVTMLAVEHDALATIGIIWGLFLLLAGVARRQRLELFFGVVGVYATGLTLILGSLESNLGAVVATLIFGLLVVAGAIIWRRRNRRLTLAEGDS